MKLYINTTSPFTRIVRVAMREKGLNNVEEIMVDPWDDSEGLYQISGAAKVPVLVLDDVVLSESLMILAWLDEVYPAPRLLRRDSLPLASVAFGVIEAAVHTLVGRKIASEGFDESAIGNRRSRTILSGLSLLDSRVDVDRHSRPSLEEILTVVAFDYVRFRFNNYAWAKLYPSLTDLSHKLSERPSFNETVPHV